jgi:DNA excision repair protein ERCC-2
VRRTLRVSVRELVEHGLRAGDLNLESFGATSSLDGIRGHQKLQGSRPDGYRAEVPISRTFESDDFVLEVKGRIDGVLERESGGDLVEEIKTTRREPGGLATEESPIHWGQLEVYACFYAERKEMAAIDTRLVYYHLDTGVVAEVERRFTLDELRAFTESLVARYLAWMGRVREWIDARNRSLDSLGFPFSSYRPGQRRMAVAVYRALREGGSLVAQAPTGIGKTAAALFPAAKAMGRGETDRVFYLTARTTGQGLAEKSLAELRATGAKLRAVTVTAKEKVCFNPEKACNGDECTFARGFYDRIEPALEESLGFEELTRNGIEGLARKHHLCPFELSLELARWSDVVVCDYNYVFDPRAYLRRFFDDRSADSTLLVDEAHNLVDRAREMYSAEVSRQAFLSLGRSLDRERDKNLLRAVHRVSGRFRDAVKRCRELGEDSSESVLPRELFEALLGFVRAAETFLVSGGGEARARVLERFFEAAWFCRVAERFDERHVTCYRVSGKELEVKLFCSDPAPELEETFSRVKASVLFSGTLTPTPYFRRTLGLSKEAPVLVLPSPFPGENLRVLMAAGVATTFRKRSTSEERLTSLLASFARQKSGNYLFFFPSYAYLNAVLRRFEAECPEVDLLVQNPEMPEPERDRFLARFERCGRERGTLVGFAVMGGFFGEGIDLPGDRLQGAAIVGVGLPALSPERDWIRERFDRDEGAGFDFAYVFHGMNRVLQAAGRVIRSESDRGVVLLVDERFAERRYRELLPAEWKPHVVRSPRELQNELEEFWRP